MWDTKPSLVRALLLHSFPGSWKLNLGAPIYWEPLMFLSLWCILYVIVFIKVLRQRWCSVDDCVVEQTGDVKSVIPFEHLDGWWEHAVSSFRSLLTEDSKTSPHDSPDDGQAVIFLTGLLEVFVYIYFWILVYSIGQLCPLSSRQCKMKNKQT